MQTLLCVPPHPSPTPPPFKRFTIVSRIHLLFHFGSSQHTVFQCTTCDHRCSNGSIPRSVDGYAKFSAYACAIKSNNCYVPGQTTMIATAGGGGLVSL
jgi:hypothetical protein